MPQLLEDFRKTKTKLIQTKNSITWYLKLKFQTCHHGFKRGRRGHARMVVGFITTYVISGYHH
jgi:hypothetical protein